MRPVCCNCNREMVHAKNGMLVHLGNKQFISGDRFECELCGALIVTSFAAESFKGCTTLDFLRGKKILAADLTAEEPEGLGQVGDDF